MGFHAKLSPSSAKRWMNCPGSVALIGDESSVAGHAAMKGTAAHKVIERMILQQETSANAYLGGSALVHRPGTEETGIYIDEAAGVLDEDGAPREHWFLFPIDDEMVNGVQIFIDEVERVKEECLDPEVYAERFLDMSWLDGRLGGTADVTIVDPGAWIHLFDYKNGRIVVEVENNEQMKNYAVGLLHEHPDAIGVKVHLIQPNAAHEEGVIRSVEYLADEIKLFEITLKVAADATTPKNAERRAGEWCTYCPANTRCPEFDALAAEEAGADFASDPYELPVPQMVQGDDIGFEDETYAADEEYIAALVQKARWIPLLDSWAKNVRAAIMTAKINKQEVPGWKLVRGKSNRAWSPDEETALAVLFKKWKIPKEDLLTKPKLKSPAQVEKTVPVTPTRDKAILKGIVASLTVKPEGKLSIARSTDPRAEVMPDDLSADVFLDDPVEGNESDFE